MTDPDSPTPYLHKLNDEEWQALEICGRGDAPGGQQMSRLWRWMLVGYPADMPYVIRPLGQAHLDAVQELARGLHRVELCGLKGSPVREQTKRWLRHWGLMDERGQRTPLGRAVLRAREGDHG